MLMKEIQMNSDMFNTTLGHGIGEKQKKKLYYYFYSISLIKILHFTKILFPIYLVLLKTKPWLLPNLKIILKHMCVIISFLFSTRRI